MSPWNPVWKCQEEEVCGGGRADDTRWKRPDSGQDVWLESAPIGLNSLKCCLFPAILFISRDSCGTGFVLVTTTVSCCCSTVLKMEHFQSPFFSLLLLAPSVSSRGFFFLLLQNFYCQSVPPPPPPSLFLSAVMWFCCKDEQQRRNLSSSTLHKEVFYSERAALCCVCMRSAQTVHVEQILYVRRWRSLQPMEAASVSLWWLFDFTCSDFWVMIMVVWAGGPPPPPQHEPGPVWGFFLLKGFSCHSPWLGGPALGLFRAKRWCNGWILNTF